MRVLGLPFYQIGVAGLTALADALLSPNAVPIESLDLNHAMLGTRRDPTPRRQDSCERRRGEGFRVTPALLLPWAAVDGGLLVWA